MRCPNCGESNKRGAKFCSNCATPLSGLEAATPEPRTPIVPAVLSVVAFVGMIGAAVSMSLVDDAPGDVGSSLESTFRAVGTVQLVLALGVLVCAIFLALKALDLELWGNLVFSLGALSVATLLVIVAEGTFAVVFLAVPGLLAVAAGVLARRAA